MGSVGTVGACGLWIGLGRGIRLLRHAEVGSEGRDAAVIGNAGATVAAGSLSLLAGGEAGRMADVSSERGEVGVGSGVALTSGTMVSVWVGEVNVLVSGDAIGAFGSSGFNARASRTD